MFSSSLQTIFLLLLINTLFLPSVTAWCSDDNFMCDNGECVPKHTVCGGAYTCGDGSDEEYCECTNGYHCYRQPTPTKPPCTGNEFRCRSEDCIPKQWQCDGEFDCVDLSDEIDCEKTTCSPDQFPCDNGACVDSQLKCNGGNDCGDNSDENICQIRTNQSSNSSNQTNCGDAFRCKDGTCVPMSNVCDSKNHCPDNSDEGLECLTACVNNQCDHAHQKTPNGCMCKCQKGYRLAGDGLTCIDILECDKEPPVCSQLCTDAIGTYSCRCYKEYTMRYDNITCKSRGSPMSVYYVVRNEIREYVPRKRNLHVVHVESGGNINAFDVDIANQLVYYAFAGNSSLHQLRVLNKYRKSIANVGEIMHIAVDWITQNIYVVSGNIYQASNAETSTKKSREDDIVQQLQVCNINRHHCAILYNSVNEDLGPIAIDPLNKYLFYTTSFLSARNENKLIRVGLGGEYPLIIGNFNATITQLSVDYRKQQLYFTQKFFAKDVPKLRVTIDRVEYDGGQVVNIAEVLGEVGTLNMFENQLYFLTNGGAIMHKCRLYGEGRRCTSFRLSNEQTPMFSVIVQATRQTPGRNACAMYNCNHLCVPTQDGANCLCEDGQVVNELSDCSD